MENASKAILIAGAMLIGVLLFSLFIYVVRKNGEETSKVYTTFEQNEIAEFNQKFFNYEGRTDLTIQDVVTIVNLAKDNNNRNAMPTKINVYVNGTNWVGLSNDQLNKKIMENMNTQYKCLNGWVHINNMIVNKVDIRT